MLPLPAPAKEQSLLLTGVMCYHHSRVIAQRHGFSVGKALRLAFVCLLGAFALPARAADVAVILSADVAPYHEAVQGFEEAAAHRIVAQYDMEGDFDRGQRILRELLSSVEPDLILAVGPWALEVVSSQPIDLPVVFTMVLNPPTVIGTGARNITGASLNVPIGQQIRLLKELGPQIRRVGVVFNPAKTGYLVSGAEPAALAEGLQLVTRRVNSPKEAIRAVNALQEEGVDALWILPDETVLEPHVVEYMLLVSYRNKIPLLGLSERQAEMGALLSLSFSSARDIGRQAGELANAILEGTPADEVPYTPVREVQLTVNLRAAQKLGLEIPNSVLAMADTVIR